MTSIAGRAPNRRLGWQEFTARMPIHEHQATQEELDAFESTLQRTLRPVAAPEPFRDGLRYNLVMAAQRRDTALQLEKRYSYRQGILLGTTIGLGAVLFGLLMYLLLRPRKQ